MPVKHVPYPAKTPENKAQSAHAKKGMTEQQHKDCCDSAKISGKKK